MNGSLDKNVEGGTENTIQLVYAWTLDNGFRINTHTLSLYKRYMHQPLKVIQLILTSYHYIYDSPPLKEVNY